MKEDKRFTGPNSPTYSRFRGEELILRDQLAIDRTDLANQRTYLSYLRTALTFFVSGISFIHFFDNVLIEVVGWIFIPIGIITFILGWIRFRKTQRSLAVLGEEETPSAD